jgi:hypothetical protein
MICCSLIRPNAAEGKGGRDAVNRCVVPLAPERQMGFKTEQTFASARMCGRAQRPICAILTKFPQKPKPQLRRRRKRVSCATLSHEIFRSGNARVYAGRVMLVQNAPVI